MNTKMISFMAGIFSILNTIQFLILELNQLSHIGFEDKYSIHLDTHSDISSWAVNDKHSICVGLSVATITISCFFLICLYKNLFVGLIIYTLWTVADELFTFALVVFTHGTIKEQFKELGYLYLLLQIFRMILQLSPLPFIVKHSYMLYKDPRTMTLAGRRKHSISTVDSWPPVRLGPLYYKTN